MARVLLVVLGFALILYVLWRIQEVLFLVFVAVLLATAIEPIVNRLRRGPFTRGTGYWWYTRRSCWSSLPPGI